MKDLIEITLDFETYYRKKSKYSLAAKGMTYEKYIRDNKFEIIGLAVKVGNRNTEWLRPHETQDWINHVEVAYGWGKREIDCAKRCFRRVNLRTKI